MRRILSVAGIALFIAAVFVATPAAAGEDAGKQVFKDQRCSLCHSLSTQDIEAMTKSEALMGPDLADVGERHEEEWLEQWLMLETEMDGKKHKKKFSGSEEELDALVDWLMEQKTEG